jgi:hypothetical protein
MLAEEQNNVWIGCVYDAGVRDFGRLRRICKIVLDNHESCGIMDLDGHPHSFRPVEQRC